MTQRSRILLVDDGTATYRAVGPLLRTHGYDVIVVSGTDAALHVAADLPPDMVVLDVAVAGGDGVDLCQRLRGSTGVPVLALASGGDGVDGTPLPDIGADDYLARPVDPDELLARIRLALRRVGAGEGLETGHLTAGDLLIDYDRHRVLRADVEIRLTPKEFELLALLARNPDRVMAHGVILAAIWGPHAVEQPEHLWALVAQLRRKIEPDPGRPRYLLSVPSVGYCFSTDGSEPAA